jgi:MFS family permease
MINVFGMGQVNLTSLAIVAGITGFFTNSAVVGLYAMLAQSYPTHLRAGGTGFVIGMGRAGAVLGPIIAGFLFEEEFSLTAVSFVMALGSLVAIFALMFLKEKAATD